MWLLLGKLLFILIYLIFSNVYAAETIRVATASNFLSPLKKLKNLYESESEHVLKISSGSTSKLYAQIINGAPYDIFLSADQSTVRKLIKNGEAIANTEFVYAIGKLVLWSAMKERTALLLQNDFQNLQFKHLAIANPKLAPYGRAAIEVIKNLKLNDKLHSRLVYGENIGQTFQFVYSGNAKLGLVALSQIMQLKEVGPYWEVPLHLYQPLKQSAVLLNRANGNIAAKSFMRFLESSKVQQELSSKYGYLSATMSTTLER